MKEVNQNTFQGLNQIFEIIHPKGDIGEIKEILEKKTVIMERKFPMPHLK